MMVAHILKKDWTLLWPLVILELWHKNFSAAARSAPIREVA